MKTIRGNVIIELVVACVIAVFVTAILVEAFSRKEDREKASQLQPAPTTKSVIENPQPATAPAEESIAERKRPNLVPMPTAATKPTTEPAVEFLKPVWLPKGPESP